MHKYFVSFVYCIGTGTIEKQKFGNCIVENTKDTEKLDAVALDKLISDITHDISVAINGAHDLTIINLTKMS
jgi:hypothetical protein